MWIPFLLGWFDVMHYFYVFQGKLYWRPVWQHWRPVSLKRKFVAWVLFMSIWLLTHYPLAGYVIRILRSLYNLLSTSKISYPAPRMMAGRRFSSCSLIYWEFCELRSIKNIFRWPSNRDHSNTWDDVIILTIPNKSKTGVECFHGFMIMGWTFISHKERLREPRILLLFSLAK